MKWTLKKDVFAFFILLIILLLSIIYYPLLPAQVAYHFNFNGEADNMTSKLTFTVTAVISAIGLYLLLTFIPFIDPFRRKISEKYDLLLLFRDFCMAFIMFEYFVNIISVIKGKFQEDLFGIGFGVLFILMGNYLPRVPRNFFFGVRTPWTLASENVWVKTHRVSGWLFVIGGIIIVILSAFQISLSLSLGVVMTPLLIYCAILYPLFQYRKEMDMTGTKTPEL